MQSSYGKDDKPAILSNSAAATALGIDTISFRLPAQRGAPWERRPRRIPHGGFAKLQGHYILIEASLPRRMHGTNLHPISAGELPLAVNSLITSAAEVAPIEEVAYEDLRITRLDIAANIAFPALQGPFLNASGLRAPSKLRPQLNIERHEHSSLTLGPRKSWKMTIYNKHAESGEDYAFGILRAEVTFRPRTLRRKWVGLSEPLTHLSEIADSNVRTLHHAAVRMCRLDEPIPGIAPGLMVSIDWSQRTQRIIPIQV